jgi:DNA-binding GntR family transcriptional regulator
MHMNGANAENAYDLLEDRIALYKYQPGARLSPDQLSNDIRIGLTPTRTALQWLHRDGLIGHQHGQGYYVKTPSVEDCAGLYRGNSIFLDGALALAGERSIDKGNGHSLETSISVRAASDMAPTPVEVSHVIGRLFTDIAGLAESEIVKRAVQTINSRLRFIRSVEASIFDDANLEFETLQAFMKNKNLTDLRKLVRVYHNRRLAAIDDIIDASFARAFRPQKSRKPAAAAHAR